MGNEKDLGLVIWKQPLYFSREKSSFVLKLKKSFARNRDGQRWRKRKSFIKEKEQFLCTTTCYLLLASRYYLLLLIVDTAAATGSTASIYRQCYCCYCYWFPRLLRVPLYPCFVVMNIFFSPIKHARQSSAVVVCTVCRKKKSALFWFQTPPPKAPNKDDFLNSSLLIDVLFPRFLITSNGYFA